jgi:hypothetical protein
VRALVMELVEGDDLAHRIARGPMPLDEALPIAKQIAEALEAAHEQGIIHRDLKPANINVRPDGTVKVLDFGLAKAMDLESSSHAAAALANSPTITSPAAMTAVGVILGTAAYMSPEQARGKSVDAHTDLWAFGCVLYEMLTGRLAFPGESVTDTLSSVISKDPAWEALPQTTSGCRPPAFAALPDEGSQAASGVGLRRASGHRGRAQRDCVDRDAYGAAHATPKRSGVLARSRCRSDRCCRRVHARDQRTACGVSAAGRHAARDPASGRHAYHRWTSGDRGLGRRPAGGLHRPGRSRSAHLRATPRRVGVASGGWYRRRS